MVNTLPGFIYTRFSDDGIDVCWPRVNAVRALSSGGWFDGYPRGFMGAQIERWIGEGVAPDAARRFVRALHFGGNTTAEALDIIREKDCAPRGKDIQAIRRGDLPKRWFRDAWRRGRNMQVNIDISVARKIQISEIENSVAAANAKRANAPRRDMAPLELDWMSIDSAIRRADDEVGVMRVWPEEIQKPIRLLRSIDSMQGG